MLETLTYSAGNHHELDQLKYRLSERKRRASEYLTRIKSAQEGKAYAEAMASDATALEKLVNENASNFSDDFLQQSPVGQAIRNYIIVSPHYDKNILEYRGYYKREIDRIRLLENQISNYKIEELTIPLEQLIQNLTLSDMVEPDSIQITEPSIFSFVFSKLKLTPTRNPFVYLNEGGNVSFRLPRIRTTIDLNRCTILFQYADPDERADAPEMYGSYRSPHPHITCSTGTPCLGDFSSPVSECFSSHDIGTLVLVLQAFLEQADSNDPAGQYWPKLIGINRRASTTRADSPSRTTYYHPFDRTVGYLQRTAKKIFEVDDEGIVSSRMKAEHYHIVQPNPNSDDQPIAPAIELTRKEYLAFRRAHPKDPPPNMEMAESA